MLNFFCLLHTLSDIYWSLLNHFFIPAIEANFVALPISPVLFRQKEPLGGANGSFTVAVFDAAASGRWLH